MDEFDQATEREEKDRALAIQQRRPEGPTATGACLHCEAVVPDGRRWCGPECRDDWQRTKGPRQ